MAKLYAVEIVPAAARDLKALSRTDAKAAKAIARKIRSLAVNPRPRGSKRLQGDAAYRVRVGNFRVLYDIEDDLVRVLVLRVRHRRDVYRKR